MTWPNISFPLNLTLNHGIDHLKLVLGLQRKNLHEIENIHVISFKRVYIQEIFLSFQGGLSKMYRIYRTILNSDQGDFQILVKSGVF